MSDIPTSDTIIDHYRGDDGYVHSVDAAEALAKVVDEYAATITTLRSQLAEAKADNARLREALEECVQCYNCCCAFDDDGIMFCECGRCKADKALIPTEPSK